MLWCCCVQLWQFVLLHELGGYVSPSGTPWLHTKDRLDLEMFALLGQEHR